MFYLELFDVFPSFVKRGETTLCPALPQSNYQYGSRYWNTLLYPTNASTHSVYGINKFTKPIFVKVSQFAKCNGI